MRWVWSFEGGAYVLRLDPPPPGTAEIGFVGRGLRPGAPGPVAGRDSVRLGQVHGTRIEKRAEPGAIPECDGARSGVAGLLLTVRTADCLPVLLSDPAEGIALVHAGWRGLAAGMLEAAVATFARPDRVHVVIGPAIRVCCYEVGPEVADRFPSGTLRGVRGDRSHLDLYGAARLRLGGLGVVPERIVESPSCTRCHQHLLYSSRGSGGAPERLIAFASAAGRDFEVMQGARSGARP